MVRQFFRIILDQADHMHALVGDLLDVARIETGTLPVGPEPAEVAALVDRARNAFKSAGGRNNLAIDIEPDLPLVMADRRRIVQVLGNLLTNAARHSPESSVIRVSAVRGRTYTWRSRWPTRGGASRPRACPTCSASSQGCSPRSREGTPAWDWPSARASWRRTGAASGPRATGRASAPASPSPCRRWRKRRAALRARSSPSRGPGPGNVSEGLEGTGAGPRGGRRPQRPPVRPRHPHPIGLRRRW